MGEGGFSGEKGERGAGEGSAEGMGVKELYYTYRVTEYLSLRPNWLPPPPPPPSRTKRGGAHWLAREGAGGIQF